MVPLTMSPHIVLIMADHLRRDSLSCYSDMAVNTPNLDALARESIVFDRAYCTTPLCTPTRSSMYTGKWPHTHGAIVNGHGFRPGGIVGAEHGTLYEALDKAGYGITQMGVHHLQSEPRIEERVPNGRFLAGMGYVEHCRRNNIGFGPEVEASMVPNVEFSDGKPVSCWRPQSRKSLFPHPAEEYKDVFWSHRMAGEIAGLDTGRPQYIEALFWAPHPPLSVPEPYYSMYPEDQIELPETVGRWYPGQPATLLWQSCGMMGLGRTREEYREAWSAHLGLTTMVDECIGRVIGTLRERGIWDDAWVIFTQDHGDLVGCHHLTGKHCFFEEAAHIPLLVKPPRGVGVLMDRRSHLISGADYCSTVCDIAAAEPPEGIEGRSWLPVLNDPNVGWRDAVFMEYNGDQGQHDMPMRSIVADVDGIAWKYNWTKSDVDELYNITFDPMEKDSLVGHSEYQGLRRELRERLVAWMEETGDIVQIDRDI
jgi:arylsulfatase A-like enzyme